MGKTTMYCGRWARCALLVLALGVWGAAGARADENWWNQNLDYQGAVSNLPGTALDVQVSGDRAYVRAETEYTPLVDVASETAYASGYVAVIDVDNAKKPKLLATWHPQGSLYDIAVDGNLLYAAQDNHLRIMDMEDLAAPKTLGTYTLPYNNPILLARVADGLAFLSDGGQTMRIVDVSNPSKPTLLGSFSLSLDMSWISDIAISGDRAFVASYYAVYIVNIANPRAPRQEKIIRLKPYYGIATEMATKIAVAGDKLYVLDSDRSIRVFNWTQPADDAELTTYNTLLSAMNGNRCDIQNIALAKSKLFIPMLSRGVQVLDVSALYSNDFMEGYYLTPGDARAARVAGPLVYVASGKRGLTILKSKP